MKNFIKNIKRTEAKEYMRKSTLMVAKGQLKTAFLWTIGAAAVFTIAAGGKLWQILKANWIGK